MTSDNHESFQRKIDETLAGGIVVGEEESLREHLASCTECQEYLAASTRVIAGLSGFSFDVDPALQEKVCASISLRAQQIESGQPSREANGLDLHCRGFTQCRRLVHRLAIWRPDRLSP